VAIADLQAAGVAGDAMTARAIALDDEAASAEAGDPAGGAEMRRKAALVVCGQSRDLAEARELLEMLGLLPTANAEEPPSDPHAAGCTSEDGRGQGDDETGKSEQATAPNGEAGEIHGQGIGLAYHIDREEAFCGACGELFKMLRESGVLGSVAE
jgi:hypothetical protein